MGKNAIPFQRHKGATDSEKAASRGSRIIVRVGRQSYAIDKSCAATVLAAETDPAAERVETKFLRLRQSASLPILDARISLSPLTPSSPFLCVLSVRPHRASGLAESQDFFTATIRGTRWEPPGAVGFYTFRSCIEPRYRRAWCCLTQQLFRFLRRIRNLERWLSR